MKILILTFILLATLNEFSSAKKFNPTEGRIVGGQAARIEDYPYQVSVIFIDKHLCGGSIIDQSYILTAAHCTHDVTASQLKIRAGSTYVDEGGQLIQVAEIFEHENFDSATYDYDIAILKLETELTLGDGVKIVGLPEEGSIADGIGVATGWGRLSENGPVPVELQQVSLPFLGSAVCETVFGDRVTMRMICAGYPEGGKDTCQGDSGGPIVADNIVYGITSWGEGCGDPNSPGIYTAVEYFRSDFIDPIINSRK